MPTIAEQWTEQRYAQGIESGFRAGLQLARRETMLENIEFGLELKFGVEGIFMLPEIYNIDDVNVLRALWQAVRIATSLDEFRAVCEKLRP